MTVPPLNFNPHSFPVQISGSAAPGVPEFWRSGFIGLCWMGMCSLRVCACFFAWGLLESFGRLTCGMACGPFTWWGGLGCWFAWRDRACVRQLQGCYQRLLLLRAPFQLLAGSLVTDQQQVSVVGAQRTQTVLESSQTRCRTFKYRQLN
jgi:hypothetical protein